MNRKLENKLINYPRAYITSAELESIFRASSNNSRYSKVKRLLAQGKLLHIRRELYCLTNLLGKMEKPHPFEIAQYIYGPSYISFESALSYHNLIPEAVHVTTSACVKRANLFDTPLGTFSYLRLPVRNFYIGVELVATNNISFFLAKPWKAICDYVFCHKMEWVDLEPLSQSLRINIEDLPIVNNEELDMLIDYYNNKRIARFLQGVKKLFL